MKDRGARRLIILVAAVWSALFGFYGFLAYRARLWSPLWAIQPTRRAYASIPERPPDSPALAQMRRGRRLYQEMRCGVCHGSEGRGGVKNPNADPDGKVPTLLDLSEAFTRRDLKDKILKGSRPPPLGESAPEPPLEMPAWRAVLSEDELEDLTAFLFSLKSGQQAGN
ncbi:MAG: cytochrome c [Elusimicrobia bacterium]|nr:cytochrome c [Elusimicrobiota bacterium]